MANLGRNDQINLFDASGHLVERLSYGDETYTGTIRTQNKSGQVCSGEVGQNNIFAWVLAASGDAFGSHAATTGELGTPGQWVQVACPNACPADLNGSGSVGGDDLGLLLGNWGGTGVGDLSGNGIVDGEDLGALLSAWGECRG